MASYLLSWLTTGSTGETESKPDIPEIVSVSPPPSDHEADDNVDEEEDNDLPPAFPALNSIQRSGSSRNAIPALSFDSKSMPPPPVLPSSRRGVQSSTLAATPTSSLTPPVTTTKRMPNTNTKAKARAKVALTPGHSPLDWARLKASGEDLRGGVTELIRIKPSELKEHRSRGDAWSAFYGKVYNITPYLAFHPGGEKELMRVAGRDGTKLFLETHSWVNMDYMLDGCMVGFLIPEDS